MLSASLNEIFASNLKPRTLLRFWLTTKPLVQRLIIPPLFHNSQFASCTTDTNSLTGATYSLKPRMRLSGFIIKLYFNVTKRKPLQHTLLHNACWWRNTRISKLDHISWVKRGSNDNISIHTCFRVQTRYVLWRVPLVFMMAHGI